MALFLFALLNPIFHSWANVVDNYLSNRLFRNISSVIFYGIIIGPFLLPVLFLFEIPSLPPVWIWPAFLIVGLTEIGYLFPYYKALQYEDTAVVSSLFSIGKIFIPVLAHFVVGETLSATRYIGFFTIVLSSTLVSLNGRRGRLRLNKSFFYMVVASLIGTVDWVAYKYLLNTVSWSTAYIGTSLATVILLLVFVFLFSTVRKNIAADFPAFRKNFWWLSLEDVLSMAGSVVAIYALSRAPVTLITGIVSIQPIFVLLNAVLFSKLSPNGMFHEKIDGVSIFKKTLLFALTGFGLYLVMR